MPAATPVAMAWVSSRRPNSPPCARIRARRVATATGQCNIAPIMPITAVCEQQLCCEFETSGKVFWKDRDRPCRCASRPSSCARWIVAIIGLLLLSALFYGLGSDPHRCGSLQASQAAAPQRGVRGCQPQGFAGSRRTAARQRNRHHLRRVAGRGTYPALRARAQSGRACDCERRHRPICPACTCAHHGSRANPHSAERSADGRCRLCIGEGSVSSATYGIFAASRASAMSRPTRPQPHSKT